MNFFYVAQFPVLRPDSYDAEVKQSVLRRVRPLAFPAPIRDYGFGTTEVRSEGSMRDVACLRAELDAYYAKLYGVQDGSPGGAPVRVGI